MADAVIAIKIVTDAASAKRGMAAAGTSVGKMQSALSKMVVPAAAAVVAIGAFGVAAIKSASATEQAIGSVDAVFGKNAGSVKKWAAGAADAVGLAKSEYMELASVMGAQLKNMGMPLDQVAGKTKNLIGIGSDLAATYGGTTKEAVEALGSALRGETDPIEKYGVSIKQADIQARMAKDGTDKLTGAAAKQAKTMTLLKMITEQTADAHGQFAEEGDTAAVQAQKLAANFENMKSDLGTALLPAVVKVTAALTKMVKWMQKNPTATKAVIAVVLALSVAIIVLTVAVNLYLWATTSAAAATLALWAAAALPVVLVVAAVLLVVAAVVLLWKKCDWFRNAVKAVWAGIAAGAKAAAAWVTNAWRATISWLVGAWGAVSRAAKVSAAWVANAWRATVGAVKAGWAAVTGAAKASARWVQNVWKSAMSAVSRAARAVANVARSAFNAIKGAISSVIAFAGRLVARLRSIRVPGAIRSAFNAIRSVIGAVIAAVGRLIGRLHAIRVPGAIVSALHAIKSAAEGVAAAVGRLVSKLQSIRAPHIEWPKPPSWFGKLKPGSNMYVPPPAPAVGRYAAPTGRSSRVAGHALTPTGSPGPTIVIQGALDPEGVARQIQRLMGGHQRRMGHAVA